MLLSAIKEEFVFHCQCRNLSPETINNYSDLTTNIGLRILMVQPTLYITEKSAKKADQRALKYSSNPKECR